MKEVEAVRQWRRDGTCNYMSLDSALKNLEGYARTVLRSSRPAGWLRTYYRRLLLSGKTVETEHAMFRLMEREEVCRA